MPAAVRPRILVVDDEPQIVDILQRLLRNDYEVEISNSGQTALDRIRADETFAAIICDINMPELDGVAFYRRLAELAPDQAKRLIFATGEASTPKVRRFLLDIPNPTLIKPVDVAILRQLLRMIIP